MISQQTASLDNRCPPHVETNHAIGSRELVSTDEPVLAESSGEDVGTDGELPPQGVDLGVVSLLFWGVRQLHVQWLQDLVKRTRGIAD